MSLNIISSRNITEEKVTSNFINKLDKMGDIIFSNHSYGTSNKIDYFDFVRTKRLYKSLGKYLGTGNCSTCDIDIYEDNNKWLNCCNIDTKGLCFDGENYRDLSKEKDIIEEYRREGWSHVKTENCRLFFEKEIRYFANDTDIHAYFDSSSMLFSDAVAARDALIEWHNNMRDAFPGYSGNLYIIVFVGGTGDPNHYLQDVPNQVERWLRSIKYSYEGSQALASTGGWATLNILPPGFGTSSYVPPTNLLILSFIDEVANLPPGGSDPSIAGINGYHGRIFPSFGVAGSFIDPLQPTYGFSQDLITFLDYYPLFTSFQQVLYPIRKGDASWAENVLHMIAAVEARIISPAEIPSFNASVDISLLTTENPYTTSLRDYGFKGVWDKVSPASAVFSSETFGEELTALIDVDKKYTLKTYADLPVKTFQEPINDLPNIWSSIGINYTPCCESVDLETLYKYSLK